MPGCRGAQRRRYEADVDHGVPRAAGVLHEPVDLLLHFAEQHDGLADGTRRLGACL